MRRHQLNVIIPLLLFFRWLPITIVQAAKTDDPFYIITHMANSGPSLDWAVSQGANAIESDLRFDSNGNPTHFEHGGICDCICTVGKEHICHVLGGKCEGSTASNDAVAHLQHIAHLQDIALFYVDSKVNPEMGATLAKVGAALIPFLDKNLFNYGYKGKVVIGSKYDTYDYIRAAAMAAKNSSNEQCYFFTFDQEGDDYDGATEMVSRFTNNRIYGTGISSCVAGTFYSGIQAGVAGTMNGQTGMTYIWTLDKESSMEKYIKFGVQGIITDQVALLKQLAISMGLKIAKPSDPIPVSTASVSSQHKCDCDYHAGGCVISRPPPFGLACQCFYKGPLTCGGTVVSCKDPSSPFCVNPDISPGTCVLGGGDCAGYQINQSCECEYVVKGFLKPRGCKIIKAMIPNLACRCQYKGAWHCTGRPVMCDTSKPKCANPDLSKEACQLGGGDCDGY